MNIQYLIFHIPCRAFVGMSINLASTTLKHCNFINIYILPLRYPYSIPKVSFRYP